MRSLHQRFQALNPHQFILRPVPARRDQRATKRQRGGNEVPEIDLVFRRQVNGAIGSFFESAFPSFGSETKSRFESAASAAFRAAGVTAFRRALIVARISPLLSIISSHQSSDPTYLSRLNLDKSMVCAENHAAILSRAASVTKKSHVNPSHHKEEP